MLLRYKLRWWLLLVVPLKLLLGNKTLIIQTLLLLWRIHLILRISNVGAAVGEIGVVGFEVVVSFEVDFFQLVTLPILDLKLLVINKEVHMLFRLRRILSSLSVRCASDGPIAVLVVITI